MPPIPLPALRHPRCRTHGAGRRPERGDLRRTLPGRRHCALYGLHLQHRQPGHGPRIHPRWCPWWRGTGCTDHRGLLGRRIRLPPSAQYVALGHLHRTQQLPGGAPIWYCGSPIQIDFGEGGDTKHVLLVDVEPGKPAKVVQRPLTTPIRLRTVEGTVAQLGRSPLRGRATTSCGSSSPNPDGPDWPTRYATCCPMQSTYELQRSDEPDKRHRPSQRSDSTRAVLRLHG